MAEPIHEEPDEAAEAESAEEIARKVKSGEYFREMRNAYAAIYLNPMSERYFFMVFTGMCLLIVLVTIVGFGLIFPLKNDIPFLSYSEDIFEEKPVIRPLKAHKDEDTNVAIRRFLVSEYVRRREAYDIKYLEQNVRFIKANSTPDVFDAWQRQLDPGNPESPISLYQRHSTRSIAVVSANSNQDGTADVIFDGIVTNVKEVKKTRMMATIAFQYTDVTINQDTGEKSPIRFLVTDYRIRRLQE